MKPILFIGLGNIIMGDDGVGCWLAHQLEEHPGLPAEVEVIDGGTDILRVADDMLGRRVVIIADAAIDACEPGTVLVTEDGECGFATPPQDAHHLSMVEAVKLLRLLYPRLAVTRYRLMSISIASAAFHPGLSPALSARLPGIVDRVLDEFRVTSSCRVPRSRS